MNTDIIDKYSEVLKIKNIFDRTLNPLIRKGPRHIIYIPVENSEGLSEDIITFIFPLFTEEDLNEIKNFIDDKIKNKIEKVLEERKRNFITELSNKL